MPARAVDGGHYTDIEALPGGVARDASARARSTSRGAEKSTLASSSSRARSFLSTQFGVAWDKRRESWTHQGEIITQFVFVLFVVFTARLNTENISLCGFMERAPNWHGSLYYWSATATGNSLAWSTMRSVREEKNAAMKCARFAAGAAPLLSLLGTLVYPRCLWTRHKRHTENWAWSVTAAMVFEWVVDWYHRKFKSRDSERVMHSDLALPQFTWCVGMLTTTFYYYTSSYQFFSGEILGAMSFSWWVMSKHRAGTFVNHPEMRVYTWREYCLVDGTLAAALLCVFRFQQFHTCAATGVAPLA
jgi:hypothetical protein